MYVKGGTELYHSANPQFVDVMIKDGFNINIPNAQLAFKNNRFGNGVYLGDSPATVLAERPGGMILKVQTDLGKNLNVVMTCPPKVAPVSKLVINWYTDFERMEKLWQGKTIRWSRSS